MLNIDKKTVDVERNGVWADYDGSRLLIASSNNVNFQREYSRLQQPHRRKIDRNSLDPDIMLDIICRALSSTIVLDWENVVGGDNKPVPFSKELAYKVLRNNSDVREFVQSFATDLNNYMQEDKEDMGKSSPVPSNGS